ncbi:MAG: hypothetical protein BAA01_12155 [Bacillus thermozeamaize]|uniref:DUF1468 domain-containing protein n=1 Tax=Bacillus thermozeamaize TaxID=230954 RepID=A0A1Y3PKG7_9BACI|nr:MAG: hypothetical protein BAA01_12155 [Bacillus thermozeamaize]
MFADRIVGVILILISAGLLYSLKGATFEASIFPSFFLVLLIVLSSLLVIKPSGSKLTFDNIKGLLIQFALILLYLFALPRIGFIISTLFYLFIAIYLSGYRKWIHNIVTTSCLTILLYFIFARYLHVNLP